MNASEGSIASFTCTTGANTTAQKWLVDSKTLSNQDNVNRGIQTFDNGSFHVMNVPATANNDGVMVHCLVKKGSLNYPSQLAELRVQGLLERACGLTLITHSLNVQSRAYDSLSLVQYRSMYVNVLRFAKHYQIAHSFSQYLNSSFEQRPLYASVNHLQVRGISGGTSFQEIQYVKFSVDVLHVDLISPSSSNIAESCTFLVHYYRYTAISCYSLYWQEVRVLPWLVHITWKVVHTHSEWEFPHLSTIVVACSACY